MRYWLTDGVFHMEKTMEIGRPGDRLVYPDTGTLFDIPDNTKCIYIPEGTKRIGEHAFGDLDYPYDKTMKEQRKKQRRSIRQVVIPEGVEVIESSAFSDCRYIEEISFPTTLKKIGYGAFSATGLKSVVLPDSIEMVGSAFSFCGELEEIVFPNKEIKMGWSFGFEACGKLKKIVLPDGLSECLCYSGCFSLAEARIPEGCTKIPARAFSNCTSITEITIPKSVREVGYAAFRGCTGLERLVINRMPKDIESAVDMTTARSVKRVEVPEGSANRAQNLFPQAEIYSLKGKLLCTPGSEEELKPMVQEPIQSIVSDKLHDGTDIPELKDAEFVANIGQHRFRIQFKAGRKINNEVNKNLWRHLRLWDTRTYDSDELIKANVSLDEGHDKYSEPLTEEEIRERVADFVETVVTCTKREALERLMSLIPRKIDGTLYKRRVTVLCICKCADSDGMVMAVYAKNTDDAEMVIDARRIYIGDELYREKRIAVEILPAKQKIDPQLEWQKAIEDYKRHMDELCGNEELADHIREIRKRLDSGTKNEVLASVLDHLDLNAKIRFAGRHFVFTGLGVEEDYLREEIEKRGGIYHRRMRNDCNYLIASMETPGATKTTQVISLKERGFDISIITEYQLWKALKDPQFKAMSDEELQMIREERERQEDLEKAKAKQEKEQKELEKAKARQEAQEIKRQKREREQERRERAAYNEERRRQEKERAELARKEWRQERQREREQRQEQERLAKEARAAQKERDRQEAIANADILFRPGEEPEHIRRRLDALFERLDGAYPDRRISGLQKNHKKMGERVTELYRLLGYPDGNALLEAYGYTVVRDNGGRPTTTDPASVIEELWRRYPEGAGTVSVAQLRVDNADLPIKTLQNNAKEHFGMPLTKYLCEIGMLSENPGEMRGRRAGVTASTSGSQEEVEKEWEEKTDRFRFSEEDLSSSERKYIDTIRTLLSRGDSVRAVDVANELGYSRASVSIMLKKLREKGAIFVMENGALRLAAEEASSSAEADDSSILPEEALPPFQVEAETIQSADAATGEQESVAGQMEEAGVKLSTLDEQLSERKAQIARMRMESRQMEESAPLDGEGVPRDPGAGGIEPTAGDIAARAHYMDYGIRDVAIPVGCREIGAEAFAFSSLGGIAIPPSVRKIGDKAFCGLMNLKSIDIPEGVREFGKQVFFGSVSLERVTLPASLERVEGDPFYGCDGLKQVRMPAVLRERFGETDWMKRIEDQITVE